MQYVVEQLGGRAELLWHGDDTTNGVDAVVVPGGFAHGDYLRTGAIARFSPVMSAVGEHARAGGPVVGICNGFQVLVRGAPAAGRAAEERGPEVPVRDRDPAGRDHDHRAHEPGERRRRAAHPDQPLRGQLRLRRAHARRAAQPKSGSSSATSTTRTAASTTLPGSATRSGNVVGLMPHPERASDALLGSADGVVLLKSLLAAAASRATISV